MEERKFIKLKKEEFGIKEYIKRDLGKGKISRLDIEYTPIGEKIIISTSKPGLVIGRRGEKINELTEVLKKRFKLENPHIEIQEIENPLFDAQLVADEIAMALERMGNLKFKVIAYRKLQEIIKGGALGCELRLTGKLPSERSRSWRFAEGYLKKAGESSKEINRAQATALTKTGVIGVKVAIMAPTAKIYDKIDINDEMRRKVNISEEDEKVESVEEKSNEKIEKKSKKKTKKKHKEKKIESEKIEQADKKEESVEVEQDGKGEEEPVQDEKAEKEEVKESDEKKQETIQDEQVEEKETIQDVVETKIKPEEDGTAMKIEEEIEEGVPQDIIDKELNKSKEEHKEKLEDKDVNKSVKENVEKDINEKRKDINEKRKDIKDENISEVKE